MSVIRIPIAGTSEEVIEIQKDNLPSNEEMDGLLGTLMAEMAPLNVWMQFAAEYYKQGKMAQFVTLMEEVTEIDEEEVLKKYTVDERVKCFNVFAGYFIESAGKSKESEVKKDDQFFKANQLLTKAEQLQGKHPSTFVSRGVMYLHKAEYDRADTQFETAKINDPKNIPAKLGHACVLYFRKDYANALNEYKDVLRTLGSAKCPASVRLGMGLCNYQLGHVEKAKACFDRVIHLSPRCVPAYVALAIIELNESHAHTENRERTAAHVKSAIQNLNIAWTIEPKNPMVLIHWANHFLYRGDSEKVIALAREALENAKTTEMKAEAYYVLGRGYHSVDNYNEASTAYFRNTQLNDKYIPARFGMGQMYIQRGDLPKALTEFTHVLKIDNDNVAANKILGSLYAKVKANRPELALRFLRRAHELHPHDEEVLTEIGQSERRDFQASLTAFLQAETIINRKVKHGHISQQSVPYQLYNNIASVQLKLGHAKEAAEYLIKAFKQANVDEQGIAELEKGNLTSTFDSETATLVYNLARTYEELKKTEEAKRIYVALAKQHPNYIECYLRLAYITNAEGNMEKAILWCKVATEIKPKDTTSWAVMGNLYLKNEAWILAQKTFEHIANNIDKNDIYTSLAMGNIFFGGIRPDLVDDTKTDRHMQYAIQFFERALKNDKNNVYAALNIGAVLAEKGYLTEAKDILQKVRENHANDNDSAISAIPETFINLGHLAMAQKQYMNAAKTYSYCLRKFYNNSNVDLLMFLAKAEFECGKFDEAERVLQKALHLEPNRLVLWFNVAVSRHEHCITILNQKVKTVDSAEAAIKLIDAATVLFQFVANASKADSKKSKKGSEKAVIVRKAKQYVETHLKQTRKKAEENVLAAKKEEERKRTLQEQQREAIKLQNEQDALARQEQERKKKEDADAIIRKAEENKRKLEELQKKWITQRPPEDTPADDDASTPTGKKPKRKKKEEGEKKKRKRKNKDDDEEQGDDETPKKKKRKTPKKKKSSDDEDQAPGSPVEEKPKKKTKRLKKKKASSDEEQEDELTISSPPTRGDYDAEEGEAEVEFGDEKETSTKDEEPKEDAMKVDEEE